MARRVQRKSVMSVAKENGGKKVFELRFLSRNIQLRNAFGDVLYHFDEWLKFDETNPAILAIVDYKSGRWQEGLCFQFADRDKREAFVKECFKRHWSYKKCCRESHLYGYPPSVEFVPMHEPLDREQQKPVDPAKVEKRLLNRCRAGKIRLVVSDLRELFSVSDEVATSFLSRKAKIVDKLILSDPEKGHNFVLEIGSAQLAKLFLERYGSSEDSRIKELCVSIAAQFGLSFQDRTGSELEDLSFWNASVAKPGSQETNPLHENPNKGMDNLTARQRYGRRHTNS